MKSNLFISSLIPDKAPFLIAALLCCSSAPLMAQTEPTATKIDDPLSAPRPRIEAHYTNQHIKVDGILDEIAWHTADSTDGIFWQTQPNQGAPSSERTVIRIVYTEENLFIGAVLYDSEPHKIIAAGLEQDYQTHNSDILGIAIDTYLDRQNAFLFAINPAGAVFDAQAFNDQAFINVAWEGIIDVKTSINEKGWIVEMAIPMTTLRFNKSEGTQDWGLNFSRRIRRRAEDSNWAPLPRQSRLYKMSQAGTLSGLKNLKQGRNLTLKPYATTTRAQDEAGTTGKAAQFEASSGFDVKWGITPQLTLDLTAFTDFSQVEVDEQQVNLTRFSLFFPERRDFFLENDGIFNYSDVRIRNYRTGSGPHNFKLFHSRKIGLNDKEPVPIRAGARLTGRVGQYDIGFLNMQTGDKDTLSAENFTVARIRKNVLNNSDIGLLFTNRQETGGTANAAFNRAMGIDANFRVLQNMLINTYFAATAEPDVNGDKTMGAMQVAWRDPLWNTSVLLKSVGENFNPGIGFVKRKAMRQAYATVGAHPQPAIPGLFELNPYIEVDYYSDLSWRLESREITPGLQIGFLNGSSLSLTHSTYFELLSEQDDILGVTLPAATYRFGSASVRYRSAPGRQIVWDAAIGKGQFYDGDRTSINGSIALRPTTKLFVQGSFEKNKLSFGGENVDANLLGLRLRYGHNTRTFLSAFLQYNQIEEELTSNVRFNFIHAPLSDIFLLFQEQRSFAGSGPAAILDRIVTLKMTKLFAF